MKKVFVLLFFLSFLNILAQDSSAVSKKTKNKSKTEKDSAQEVLPPALGDIFKPKIGLGTGMFSFFGDVYSKNYQAPWTSRLAYDLSIAQPINKSIRLNFYVLFGRLGANERIDDKRYVNFESQIRLGGLNVMYTFDHFFSDNLRIRPWVSAGIEGFEFLSKTDLFDRNGNKYHYWSDGSIRNMDENAAGSQNAVELVRDYTYESDVRELNLDGFGKYPERSWAIPIGGGALMKIGERFEFKMGASFHYSFTDYIDGISNKSTGTRAGNKRKDCFVMTSFSLHYDLIVKRKNDTLPKNDLKDEDFLALDNDDEDGDKVRDFDDLCHGTPAGLPVDKNGCPLDDDGDWIPNYRDDEENTPKTILADGRGVGYTDEMFNKWYDFYFDSTGSNAQVVRLGNVALGQENIAGDTKNNQASGGDGAIDYTVEVAHFTGPVPDEEMLYLLSVGDVKSKVSDGTTTYTAGSYKDIKTALERKAEFEAAGIKHARIGVFKDGEYRALTDEELNQLTGSSTTNPSTLTINPSHTNKGVVFRVQLGAYKRRINTVVFGRNAGSVLEVQTDDGYYHYVSGAYTNLQDAALHRADIVLDGYPEAFITAYKDGKRITMKEAGATFENKGDEKENLNEKATAINTVDKSLVTYKVQLSLKKGVSAEYEEKIKGLKNVEKQITATGMIRYTSGTFAGYNEAVKYKNQLVSEGYAEVFVIALFKNELISIQEALEFQK